MSKSLTWIKFDATVEEAESLLQTEYGIYTHATTGKDHLACESYSLPAHIREHVDFITPTVHFDATVKLEKKRRDLEGRSLKVKPVTQIKENPNPIAELAVPQPQITFSFANCFTYITPDCLRALYNFTNGTLAQYGSPTSLILDHILT
jgi:tripeptidyl-peptidase-1